MGDSSFVVMLCVALLAGTLFGWITGLMFFVAVSSTTARRTVQLLHTYQSLVPVRADEGIPKPVKFGPGVRPTTGKLIRDWHRASAPDQPTQPHPIVGKNGMHPF